MAPANNKKVSIGHNLCALPKEQQERVEVEKAAAYAVWKERNGHLGSAESEARQHKGELGSYFLEQVAKYKKLR
ncbi:DUF3283 family protein [Aeromonas veronii]|uniref:DUF3283 family protein n=1 Tax=Aeromonas veronii TaxID=654 RepID=UPI0038B45B72